MSSPGPAAGSVRQSRDEPRFSRVQVLVSVAIALVVVVGAAVSWIELRPTPDTHLNAGLVHRVTCTGANVQHAVMVANEQPATIVLLAPPMRCPVDLVIRNTGSRAALLQSVTFPGLGPDAKTAIQVTGPGAVSTGLGTNATFTVNKTIRERKKVNLTFWLVFRATGCTPSGAVESRFQIPQLTYTVDGHTRTSHGHAVLAWRGTDDSTCPAGS